MKVVSVISAKIREGFLYTKLLKSGKSDVQDVKTASLPGIDSVPLEDDRALYETTDVSGENFVIGFLVKNRKAEPGEVRFFSLNDNKGEEIFIHLKKNGEIHFGGEAGNLTRFQELEQAFNQLKADHNTLATRWNQFTTSYLPGGPSNQGAPLTLLGSNVSLSTADVSQAKIDKLKTL